MSQIPVGDKMENRSGRISAGCSTPPLHPLANSQGGPFDIFRLAYSEVTSFLSSSPCNHVFTIEEDTFMNHGLGTYEYSVADCKEIDVSLFEGVMRPFLENLKPIVMPVQTSLFQMQPLISMDRQQQEKAYRTIKYEVENLFPEESSNILPSDNSRDNIAGELIFHRATPVPERYKNHLLGNEGGQRNMSRHLFAVTMKNDFGKVVVLKLYVNEINGLKQVAVDLLTPDGKARQYKTLEECFRFNDQVKQAVKVQLLPMVDTIIKSVKEYQPSSGESSSDNTSIEQRNSGKLFELATPVPPSQYRTLQAGSKSHTASNKKHAVTRWLCDDLNGRHAPKLDPLLDPNCFKRAREHVGEPSTAAGGPLKFSKKTMDEQNAVAQTPDVMMKGTRKMSTSDRGESGFSSAQMSRYSSFNQARGVMQAEKQLSMEIEAELFRTEDIEADDTDEDKK